MNYNVNEVVDTYFNCVEKSKDLFGNSIILNKYISPKDFYLLLHQSINLMKYHYTLNVRINVLNNDNFKKFSWLFERLSSVYKTNMIDFDMYLSSELFKNIGVFNSYEDLSLHSMNLRVNYFDFLYKMFLGNSEKINNMNLRDYNNFILTDYIVCNRDLHLRIINCYLLGVI